MNILALDTCTECCSVALSINEQLFTNLQMTQRGHSELILGMMDELFADSGASIADVEALAFGRGPGSFTGVRVGVGVTQGIAFARDIPVIPVSTLGTVAQAAINTHQVDRVAVAMDARMGEVYVAHFENQGGYAILLDEEKVCPPTEFMPFDDGKWFAAGTGWREYENVLSLNYTSQVIGIDPDLLPNAENLIKLARKQAERGELLPAEQALPVYLRDNVAKKKGEQ
jgi:tRNA threonylcarbamoyladenosine biosynthesis protein TsaB